MLLRAIRVRWLGSLDPGHQHRTRLVREVIEQNVNSRRVLLLDVGCGDAQLCGAMLLGPLRGRLTYLGLDSDVARVRCARVWTSDSSSTRALMIGGSAGALPLKPESCDSVVCIDVLEHVEDWEAAVKEMGRLLRPRGVLVIHVPLDRQERFFSSLRQWSQRDHVRIGLAEKQLCRSVADAGILVERVQRTFGPGMRVLWELGEFKTALRTVVRVLLAPLVRFTCWFERCYPPSTGNGLLLVGRK